MMADRSGKTAKGEVTVPALGACMRGGREALEQANLALWELVRALGLDAEHVPELLPESKAELSRLAGKPNRALVEGQGLPWAQRRRLAVTFMEAERLDAAPAADAQATRRRLAEQRARLEAKVLEQAQSEKDRQGVENLLRALRDPERAFPVPRSGDSKR